MLLTTRLKKASKPTALHLLLSLVAAGLSAVLVFVLWYPYPYREFSGGRELFVLVMAVDVVCGPLLTLVLFNPVKPRAELWRDLGLVALIQLAALVYGLHAVWLARPLYLVQEIDRFKVVTATSLDRAALLALPDDIAARLLHGPQVVALRAPVDATEREKVLMESVQGGRDYAERPEFYVAYSGAAALKSLDRARPLAQFLTRYPSQRSAALALAAGKVADVNNWLYLPVVARQDWVAVLDKQGAIQGFLRGDGF